jgi:hypothetical protein
MVRMTGRGFSRGMIITSIIAGFLLLVVNSAIWVNRQIFDENNFTKTTVTSLTSQSSRDAIAGKITDKALQNYPRLQNAADDRLNKLISGLLDGERVHTVLTKSVSKLHIYLTSKNQKDVVVNLAGVKDTINKLAEITGRDENGGQLLGKVNNMPDEIVLVNAQNVPDFYKYGVAVSFIAPIALLIALVLMALPYIKDKANYLSIMLVQGITLVVVGLVAMLVGPLFRPVALSSISDPNGRVIADNLYNSFLASFNSQNLWLIIIGLLMCAGVIVAPFLSSHRAATKK